MSKKEEKDSLFCSFCGKSQKEVKKLIAGPTVFVCDECVELCICLLYTSPSPRDATLSRMPSSA